MTQEELHDLIKVQQPNICQVVAYKDNEKVYSDCWNGYKEDDCTHVMSVTKSIIALLIGIALDQEKIRSIDDHVLDYFPDYKVKRGEKTIYDVTIRHLLTMRAPYKCKGDPWTKVCSSENWTYASLDFLGGRKGLTDEFSYQTVCLHILSGILFAATHMKTVDYANQYLFEPLGIRKHVNYEARSAEEHKQFTISKTPKDHVWFCDRDGLGTPGYGLCMSAEDMAKIGLLCLNHGTYQGRQVVSAEWIEEMTRPRTVEGDHFRGMDYGYLWWIIDRQKHIYAAIGNSGNVIYVDPDKNVVISVASYFKPTVFDRVDFIQKYIEPMITEALTLERITEDNLPYAVRIQEELFPGESARTNFEDSLAEASDYEYFLLYEGGSCVGVIGIYNYPEAPDSAWLGWFGIRKDFRRKHLGSQALAMFEEMARAKGFRFARLYTDAVNNDVAIAFYQANGYRCETYQNPQDPVCMKIKTLIFSKALTSEELVPWDNRSIHLTEQIAKQEKYKEKE